MKSNFARSTMLVGALSLGAPLLLNAEPTEGQPVVKKEEKQVLGTVKLKGYSVEVVQDGKVEAGKEATFALTLTKAEGTAEPKSVLIWVGTEDAKGSVRTKTHSHGDKMEAHVDVPNPLPVGSKVWVLIRTAEEKLSGCVEFKP